MILPVWHNISGPEVRAYSPTLADKLGVSSSKGLDHVTDQLLKAIGGSSSVGGMPAASTTLQSTRSPRQLADYALELHRRGVTQLLAGKTPVAVQAGRTLVMHVAPFGAIGEQSTGAFDEICRNPEKFPPIGSFGRDYQISYDGLVVGSNAEGLSKPQRAYVSVSRAGVIEAVETSLARGRDHCFFVFPEIEALIVKHAHRYPTDRPPYRVEFAPVLRRSS